MPAFLHQRIFLIFSCGSEKFSLEDQPNATNFDLGTSAITFIHTMLFGADDLVLVARGVYSLKTVGRVFGRLFY